MFKIFATMFFDNKGNPSSLKIKIREYLRAVKVSYDKIIML